MQYKRNLFILLLNFQGDFKAQKEAAWVVTNFTSGGSTEQIIYLVRSGVLVPFCNLLSANEAKTILVVLDGLSHILEVRWFQPFLVTDYSGWGELGLIYGLIHPHFDLIQLRYFNITK